MSFSASIRRGVVLAGLLAAVCVGAMAPAFGASPAKPAIAEEASAALLQMGQALLSKQYSFQARTLQVYPDAGGRFLHIGHNFKVVARRPDRLRVEMDGDDGTTQIFYDGKTLVLYAPARKEYVSLAVPDTIDGMLKEAEARLGVDFPLADFLSLAPNKAFLTGVTEGKVVGEVTVNGVPSRHMTFLQPPGIELEMWLAKTDQSLPQRLFITYRSVSGQPNFIAQFADWNLSATPTDADFVFQPPDGAKQVELKPASSAPQPAAKAKGAKQ